MTTVDQPGVLAARLTEAQFHGPFSAPGTLSFWPDRRTLPPPINGPFGPSHASQHTAAISVATRLTEFALMMVAYSFRVPTQSRGVIASDS